MNRDRERPAARRTILLLGAALLLAAIMATVSEACPTCKDGLAEANPAQQAMARGYFYSILFMMSMPFLILGTFGSCAYFSIRRAQSARETGHPHEPGPAP